MTTELTTYTLDELCEFTNGFAFKSKDYIPEADETVNAFRMRYIERGGGFKEDTTPVFVPREYGRDLSKFMLRPGDVTIAMTHMKNNVAILGNTARVTHADRFVLKQRVGCIRVSRPDVLDPRFFYYYCSNSAHHIQDLRSRANSGVQVNLSTAAIKESELHLPPLPEQRLIASILGALDDKIELNRRMNRTLESLARAICKSWFVDFDPVKINASQMPASSAALATHDPKFLDLFLSTFQDSELGPIPEGWEPIRLELILELAYGKALKKSDRIAGQFPIYGSGGLTGSQNESLVAGPGVIVGRKGSVGTLYWEDSSFYPIDTVFYVKPNDGYSLQYIFYLLQTLGLDDMNTDAAVPGLNRNNAYRLEIPSAFQEAMHEFTKAATAIRNQIAGIDLEIAQLATLRDSLLPQFLSGDLPVAAALSVTEEVFS